jgi:cellobiose-specific phosphotransferase system component IIC
MKTKSITTQSSNLPALGQQRIEALDTALMLTMSLMIFSTICMLIYDCFPKSRKYSSNFNLFNSVPCHRCQYFSNNAHLKCTIHPTTAMTKQAINCRDYYKH